MLLGHVYEVLPPYRHPWGFARSWLYTKYDVAFTRMPRLTFRSTELPELIRHTGCDFDGLLFRPRRCCACENAQLQVLASRRGRTLSLQPALICASNEPLVQRSDFVSFRSMHTFAHSRLYTVHQQSRRFVGTPRWLRTSRSAGSSSVPVQFVPDLASCGARLIQIRQSAIGGFHDFSQRPKFLVSNVLVTSCKSQSDCHRLPPASDMTALEHRVGKQTHRKPSQRLCSLVFSASPRGRAALDLDPWVDRQPTCGGGLRRRRERRQAGARHRVAGARVCRE